jgi:hypothetical protein
LYTPQNVGKYGVQEFLETRCATGINHIVPPKDIWRDYCEWALPNGYVSKSREELEIDLQLRGFTQKYLYGHLYWTGLKLQPKQALLEEEWVEEPTYLSLQDT